MTETELALLIEPGSTAERNGIFISNNLAQKTVWDTKAEQNPTEAVISAKDEAEAAQKSADQIKDISRHIQDTDILLDFGCGYGRIAQYLLPQRHLRGYIGVDSSYNMLKLFKQRHNCTETEQGTPIIFLNADIHTTPLRNNSVDVAIVCAVLQYNHKDTVEKSIDELKRILKPEGRLLIYSALPRGINLMGLQGYAYQMFLNLIGKPFKNGPIRYYTKQEVVGLFQDFSQVDLIPTGFAVLPTQLIFIPKSVSKLYEFGIADPVNGFLERICPTACKHWFATHFNVIAIR